MNSSPIIKLFDPHDVFSKNLYSVGSATQCFKSVVMLENIQIHIAVAQYYREMTMKPDYANIAFAASTQIRFEIALKTQTQHVVWNAVLNTI